MKKLDFIKAEVLGDIIKELNKLKVQKEDLVDIKLPDKNNSDYIAFFYYEKTKGRE